MKHFLRAVRFLIPTIAFGFLAYQSQGYIFDLKNKSSSIDLPLLTGSLFLLLPIFIMNAFGWHLIIKAFNCKLNFSQSVNIWMYSSFTRYIPGVIWPYATRIKHCSGLGISKYDTANSMLLENCFLASCSLCISLPIIGVYFNNRAAFLFIVLCIIVLLYARKIFSFLLSLKVQNEFLKKIITSLLKLESKDFISIWGFYCMLWILFSTAFGLFSLSITSIDKYDTFTIIQVAMCFPISFAVGFIATITPGGIGIREGALYALLVLFIDVQDAAVISIASRLWLIFAEIIIGCTLILKTSIDKRTNC